MLYDVRCRKGGWGSPNRAVGANLSILTCLIRPAGQRFSTTGLYIFPLLLIFSVLPCSKKRICTKSVQLAMCKSHFCSKPECWVAHEPNRGKILSLCHYWYNIFQLKQLKKETWRHKVQRSDERGTSLPNTLTVLYMHTSAHRERKELNYYCYCVHKSQCTQTYLFL